MNGFAGFGPMEGMLKAYWKNVDSMMRAAQPQAKALTRAQIEAGGFVTKRLKAHMELPGRMAACRTPMDAMAQGAQFWLEAFEDYAVTSQRALQIAGFAAPAPLSRISDWQSPYRATVRERDVMDLRPRAEEPVRERARVDQAA